jgi:hypothetical protein
VARRRGRYGGDERSGALLKVLGVVVVGLIVTGMVALATLDLKPPTRPVEKVIPNDRF